MKCKSIIFSKNIFHSYCKRFTEIFNKRFEDKVVIVTGGASGIGRATCLRAAREGAKVVIADINEKKGEETNSEINNEIKGNSIFIKADISKSEDTENLTIETFRKFGKIDVLINNAAKIVLKGFEATREEWIQAFLANELGTATLTKQASEYLKKTQGSIVYVVSICSLIAIDQALVYSSNKGALMQMTRNMALELAKYKIRVNGVCPGYTLTPTLDTYAKEKGISLEELLKPLEEKTLVKRVARPEEIANAILFLASQEASYIIGTNLVVDGGYTVM